MTLCHQTVDITFSPYPPIYDGLPYSHAWVFTTPGPNDRGFRQPRRAGR